MRTTIPTKSLYFENALKDEISVLNETRHSIELDDRIIYFRLPYKREINRLSNKKIITIVDDNYLSIIHDKNQPLGYRARMLSRYLNGFSLLRNCTQQWLTANDEITALYLNAQRIDPYWDICQRTSPVRVNSLHIGFLGSRSHLKDLDSILPPLLSFLQDFPQVRFTLFLGKHCPPALANLVNVNNCEPSGWKEHHQNLQSLALDISLLPSLPTKVNACRSTNKLFEAVYAGGVCAFDSNYSHKDYALKEALGINYSSIGLKAFLVKSLHSRAWLELAMDKAYKQSLIIEQAVKNRQRELLLNH